MHVPATVQALLAARIDRLGEREKEVLQAAAVIGKDFAEPILQRVSRRDRPVAHFGNGSSVGATRPEGRRVHLRTVALSGGGVCVQASADAGGGAALATPGPSPAHACRRGPALEEAYADRLDETAALLAHHHEEADEALTPRAGTGAPPCGPGSPTPPRAYGIGSAYAAWCGPYRRPADLTTRCQRVLGNSRCGVAPRNTNRRSRGHFRGRPSAGRGERRPTDAGSFERLSMRVCSEWWAVPRTKTRATAARQRNWPSRPAIRSAAR